MSRRALVKLLQAHGWLVDSATNLKDGLALLAQEPECVILDLMLPDGDGCDLLALIRRESRPIRVAIATGSIDPARLNAARNLFADLIIHKPIDIHRLVEFLQAPPPGEVST